MITQTFSDSTILSWFVKSAKPNPCQRYSRQLHNLSPDARRYAIRLMAQGVDACKAIRKAKREVK